MAKRLTRDEEAEIRTLGGTMSRRALAARFGVSHTTINNVLAAGAPAPLVAPAPAPAALESTPVLPDTTEPEPIEGLATLAQLIRENHEQQILCSKIGDSIGAQRYSRTVAYLMGQHARVERDHHARNEEGFLRISRAEIAEVHDNTLMKVAAYLNRPLLCAHCNRALSVDFGQCSEKVRQAIEDGGQVGGPDLKDLVHK